MQKYLVVSYDDDQQQWFWDYVAAKTAEDAVAHVCERRPYVIAADAAELSSRKTLRRITMTQQYTGAALASQLAAQEWGDDFADLLVCYNAESVNKALFGAFATTHRQDQPIGYDELCRVFIGLIDRGVLVPEFKADIADEQLEEMRSKFASTALTRPASQVEFTPIDECAEDYKRLSSAPFKRKWFGTRRATYEAAIAAGRIR